MASAGGTRCRRSPFGVPASNGPNRASGKAAAITPTLSFFRLTSRGKAWARPVTGSISANSSPISRHPRVASSAASVDLPAPDSPVINSARPSRSTAEAWSSRYRRSPSASCRFIAISAASTPQSSGIGTASGSVKSPPSVIAGRTTRRQGRAANRRTL